MSRAAILAAAAAFALSAPAGARVFSPDSFTLDNGMQVVVVANHRAPVVTHMVWYRAGAMDQAPGRTGAAHLLEHLMFKGTEAYPDGVFSQIVARNGGRENAFTSQDFTTVLADAGVAISMDGRGRYLDNIFIERLWRSVKYEDIYLWRYDSVPELERGLHRYFDFYNTVRPHQALYNATPEACYLAGCERPGKPGQLHTAAVDHPSSGLDDGGRHEQSEPVHQVASTHGTN